MQMQMQRVRPTCTRPRKTCMCWLQVRVEIDLGDSGMTYTPGDALGICPSNRPEVQHCCVSGLWFSVSLIVLHCTMSGFWHMDTV